MTQDEQGATGPASEPSPTGQASGRRRWSAGRVVLVVLGCLLALVALALIVGGGAAITFDQTQRDSSGYLMTDSKTYSTGTYALVSNSYRAGTSNGTFVVRGLLGTVRIRSESSRPVFVGLARASDVDLYLTNVGHQVVTRFDAGRSDYRLVQGGAPSSRPETQGFWVASAVGTGPQSLSWKPKDGSWRVVLMNPDAKPGVTADLSIGARFPNLLWIGIAVLSGGIALLLVAGVLIFLGLRRARTEPQPLPSS